MAQEGETEGRFRFRLGRRDQIVLYKHKDETASHVLLKAAAYALYFRECENLQLNPRLDYKVQPDLAALDLEGQPRLWIQCINGRDVIDLEYICKHVPAEAVILLAEEEDTEALVARVKRRVHFKYAAAKLRVINFHEPVADWLDPENVEVPTSAYDVVDF
ncbi:MAG: YaeQ family protein [Candidatus Sericytochromatia bacterium]|uniref:YaeQ family protein n=1 Tax=Candidatus Tanganyikabacteria bacterium TaxID=2961651 RepID=A0A938BJR1_9BACT|nr:YaeQ family protein [Candidatus Tanganyikabacteria bacterium]